MASSIPVHHEPYNHRHDGPCTCELNNHRFDRFERQHQEPSHYPKGIQSSYTREYQEKSLTGKNAGVFGPAYSKSSAEDAFKVRRNPITGTINGKAPIELNSTNHSDYRRNPLSSNHWINENRAQARVDHLNSLIPGDKANWKPSTEYREANNRDGKDIIIPAHAKLNLPAKVGKIESKTNYSKDFTPKIGQREYTDPRPAYEENKKVAQSALSANHLAIGGEFAQRSRPKTTTYEEDFKRKSAKQQDQTLTTSTYGGSIGANKPSALNNWHVQKPRLDAESSYHHDYQKQTKVDCCCPETHMQAVQEVQEVLHKSSRNTKY